MDLKLIVPKNPKADMIRLNEEQAKHGCCEKGTALYPYIGCIPEIKDVIILTLFSLNVECRCNTILIKNMKKEQRKRQDGCISLLLKK